MRLRLMLLTILMTAVSFGQELNVQFPVLNPIFTGDMTWNGQVVSHPWILGQDGALSMYYYTDYNLGPYVIARAQSSDGFSWNTNPSAPMIYPGAPGDFDGSHVIYPSVVALPGGGYHMLYTGWDNNGYLSVGYASSPDGTSWTKYSDNPVLAPTEGAWDSERVADAFLLHHNGSFHAWHAGFADISDVSIGYASSEDGISWTKEVQPVLTPTYSVGDWDSHRVYAPSVLHDGRVFHMFYVGTQSNNAYRSIGHALSIDGVNWFRDANGAWITPVLCDDWAPQSTSSPYVIQDQNIFKIWFTGNLTGSNWNIGYAEVTYYNNPGDVTLDGSLSVSDLVTLVTIILGSEPEELALLEVIGDMNDDSELTIQDITLLVQTLLGGSPG